MLKDLIEGYRAYRLGWSEAERDLYRHLVENGQAPKVMIIACCDSRVDPSVILGAKPGSLFTLRNIANLVPSYSPDGDHHGTSAALEFAVAHLHVEHIIVLGHGLCGGIRTLFEADPHAANTDFIMPWMQIAAPARDHVRKTCSHLTPPLQQRALEQEAIKVSMNNLMTFPWIKERVEKGALHLHGWYYALAEGLLMALDPERGNFRSLLGAETV